MVRFSHVYQKMPWNEEREEVPKKAQLLEVFVVNRKDLHESFVRYDTRYYEELDEKFYKLPDGMVLVLLLMSTNDYLWTTIRQWSPQKEHYYRNLRGTIVDIEIKEEGTDAKQDV